MMEATRISKTSINFYQATQRNNPEKLSPIVQTSFLFFYIRFVSVSMNLDKRCEDVCFGRATNSEVNIDR
jgi:hypothetical protein